MDILLGKVTQQAMNYAIRSGITITSTYAIRECSRLLNSTAKGTEREELRTLQNRLDSKIRIISPAIDMIELISARGNTSLESAVTLTKSLRWDIQALGIRLAKAANAEEISRRGSSKTSKDRHSNEMELKLIIKDIRELLERIEDAVPLINLAITTSGASLSSALPASISPSRLLQASTFLTAGDTQFSIQPGTSVQIGPSFTLSLYMLFAGHTYRSIGDESELRETTWKEVLHKARVKLLRVPLDNTYDLPDFAAEIKRDDGSHYGKKLYPPLSLSNAKSHPSLDQIAGEYHTDEYAYQLLIIEDLNDDRVHTFEEDEAQPGPYEDVEMAGIREVFPIHEISKIFYADTGKILNIGKESEANNPILLLKRDVNAVPPRRMMERATRVNEWYEEEEGLEPLTEEENQHTEDLDESQLEINAQLGRESSVPVVSPIQAQESKPEPHTQNPNQWRLPPGLDPEWLAFEVYTEPYDPSDDEGEEPDLSTPSKPPGPVRSPSLEPNFIKALSRLQLNTPGSQHPASSPGSIPPSLNSQSLSLPNAPGAIRSSLSLLEMLIRLTALQQFQQQSHLSINDELLNFFLEESSTTGAGADGDERRRKRRDARRRVGFDPYDESPVKRRGEIYQTYHEPSVDLDDYDDGYDYDAAPTTPLSSSGVWGRNRNAHGNTPASPQQLLLRNSAHASPSSRAEDSELVSSPSMSSPLRGVNPKARQAFFRRSIGVEKVGKSPLGRPELPTKSDSGVGTSPGSAHQGVLASVEDTDYSFAIE
ncbi:MAG: hypothetical protein M1829_005041 [Trizodia sp. TS-e1964]|nr:MAG: hypothetical protein M1829_005041 [Trizodia sp. TS-e1964]